MRKRKECLVSELGSRGERLVPYLENLTAGRWLSADPGRRDIVGGWGIKADNGLAFDWIGVGVWMGRGSVFGPELSFRRGRTDDLGQDDPVRLFFPDSEPFIYRVLFHPTMAGTRYLGIERWLVRDGSSGQWQACDSERRTYYWGRWSVSCQGWHNRGSKR